MSRNVEVIYGQRSQDLQPERDSARYFATSYVNQLAGGLDVSNRHFKSTHRGDLKRKSDALYCYLRFPPEDSRENDLGRNIVMEIIAKEVLSDMFQQKTGGNCSIEYAPTDLDASNHKALIKGMDLVIVDRRHAKNMLLCGVDITGNATGLSHVDKQAALPVNAYANCPVITLAMGNLTYLDGEGKRWSFAEYIDNVVRPQILNGDIPDFIQTAKDNGWPDILNATMFDAIKDAQKTLEQSTGTILNFTFLPNFKGKLNDLRRLLSKPLNEAKRILPS